MRKKAKHSVLAHDLQPSKTALPESLTQLVKVCRRHTLRGDTAVVVPEPYVPFVPTKWNGLLVTAEAQNLSDANAIYRSWILKQGPKKRILRLYEYGRIGIAPWTDGTMPLAAESALNADPQQTAVSNAVPWSLIGETNGNVNPSSELVEHAQAFWRDTLIVLKPKVLLVCGKVGRQVFSPSVLEVSPQTRTYFASSPSAQLLSRVSGLFSSADLLKRYPEVERVVGRRPELLKKHRRNKVFFACHVTSLVKGE